ncbi:MAG: hypothetical protein RBG13Loki_4347 [Promethearchaeota archaeon CR_4]|nr:MAG: hypothetical protein RBG13Loki_4347 [Candidatus Lokiarchaeota archaeon CR_4]
MLLRAILFPSSYDQLTMQTFVFLPSRNLILSYKQLFHIFGFLAEKKVVCADFVLEVRINVKNTHNLFDRAFKFQRK